MSSQGAHWRAGYAGALGLLKAAKSKPVPDGVRADTPVVMDTNRLKSLARPGDIYITGYEDPADKSMVSKAITFFTKSPFTHSGVVDLEGRAGSLIGKYNRKTKKFRTDLRYRTHSFRTLGEAGASVLLLRPKEVSHQERKRVAETLGDTGKRLKYSIRKLLRNAAPPKTGKTPGEVEKLTEGVCTLLPALKYPKLNVRRGYSRDFIRPKDYVNSSKLKQVVLYRPKKNAEAGRG